MLNLSPIVDFCVVDIDKHGQVGFIFTLAISITKTVYILNLTELYNNLIIL